MAQVKAERLPAPEALRQIRQIEKEWAVAGAAQAAEHDKDAPAFKPIVGQRVAVRSMGGSAATVMSTGSKVGHRPRQTILTLLPTAVSQQWASTVLLSACSRCCSNRTLCTIMIPVMWHCRSRCRWAP